jgi:multidrug efflux pump subunit AcrB
MMTIPIALLSATVALWAAGQSINVMTLGGLTLAIGILVDESIIAIENIHTHLARGTPTATAVLEASREVVVPRLLAMLCVVSVFAPSFFMEGVARAMFVPLALAVAFAMIASYFLASTFVPIMETWFNPGEHQGATSDAAASTWLEPIRARFDDLCPRLVAARTRTVAVYGVTALLVLAVVGLALGTDIFPRIDTNAIQMRLRAPSGTRVERTERIAQDVLRAVEEIVGPDAVEASIAFVGVQPSSYPVNLIFLWTGGPHEAVMRIAFDEAAGVASAEVEERLRERLPQIAPGTTVTFEAPDLVSQVMSFGAPTPVEIAVAGPSLPDSEAYARRAAARLGELPFLRDVELGELLDYPSVEINVDRERAAQLDVTVADVGRALGPATWSSRFTTPVYWADPSSGIAYQVQVEIPQAMIASIEDLSRVPVRSRETTPTLVGDVADVTFGDAVGEYHRYNMQRMVTITANIAGEDLGTASVAIRAALDELDTVAERPRGLTVDVRGQIAPMELMVDSLQFGLLLSIVTVFLLLAAYFQSVRVALVVVAVIPAVLAGVGVALLLSGSTLNIQSFMGAIMAVGVSVANSILLCTFAEQARRAGESSVEAAVRATRARVRPIVMTTVVMIAGMLPLALGAEQTAPLGIAVIGGLLGSTITVLTVIPSVFAAVQQRASVASPSIDPEDPSSPYHRTGPQSGPSVA